MNRWNPAASFLLLLAGAGAACAAPRTDALPWEEGPRGPASGPEAGSFDPREEAGSADTPYAGSGTIDSCRLGAWGWRADVRGKLQGAAGDFDGSASTFPAGYSFEWRRSIRQGDGDLWISHGILLEHFQEEEEEGGSVPGGDSEARGRLSGILFPVGISSAPRGGEGGEPAWFPWRVDLLGGMRSGSVRAEVPDGFGGSESESSSWVEFCIGARVEVSPLRSLTLFARGEFGGSGGSFTSEADSIHAMAGVRWRPVPHTAVLAGWRMVRLRSEDFSLFGPGSGKVTFASDGPWIGLEVEF